MMSSSVKFELTDQDVVRNTWSYREICYNNAGEREPIACLEVLADKWKVHNRFNAQR